MHANIYWAPSSDIQEVDDNKADNAETSAYAGVLFFNIALWMQLVPGHGSVIVYNLSGAAGYQS